MSIIKHVTLQKIVAHDFRYDLPIYFSHNLCQEWFYSQYVIVFLEAFHILVLIKELYWNTVYFQYCAKLG